MMTMIETKTNDTMKKTDNTMDDASECVSARACAAHAYRRTYKPTASLHEAAPRHSTHCSSDRHCARRTTL